METKAAPQQPRRERETGISLEAERLLTTLLTTLHADAEAIIRTATSGTKNMPAKILCSAQLQYGAYSDV
jgi:hypothetical protein